MRGRPISGEEFDRLIAAVPKVRPKDSAAWAHYLTGLWLSGLRLEESTILSWDDDAPFAVDLSGRHPPFRIIANKGAGEFATAHDLRRSFGTRWAPKVKPATLQALMRHKSIQTTLDYYVALDTDDVAAELWREHRGAHTLPHTPRESTGEPGENDPQPKDTSPETATGYGAPK